jgi:hypothetical protein
VERASDDLAVIDPARKGRSVPSDGTLTGILELVDEQGDLLPEDVEDPDADLRPFR